jgi:hypothetical protein
MAREANHGTCHDRPRVRRCLQQRKGQRLCKLLAGHLKKFGLGEFDASVLQQTAPRILTQFVSRIVFNGGFPGIYYRSKYGHDIENWALFEPFQIKGRNPRPFDQLIRICSER